MSRLIFTPQVQGRGGYGYVYNIYWKEIVQLDWNKKMGEQTQDELDF